MSQGQPTPLDEALMARLVAACRPSLGGSAIGMDAGERGDYARESLQNHPKGSTLGSTIKRQSKAA